MNPNLVPYEKRTFPVVVFGYIRGEIRREFVGRDGKGNEEFYPPRKGKGTWLNRDCAFSFPVEYSTGTWLLPHQQKKSPFGFLFIRRERGFLWTTFHFWWHWHLQERGTFVNANGPYEAWVPNSERGVYTRFTAFGLLALLTPLLHWFAGQTLALCGALSVFYFLACLKLIPTYRFDFEEGMRRTRGYFGSHWD